MLIKSSHLVTLALVLAVVLICAGVIAIAGGLLLFRFPSLASLGQPAALDTTQAEFPVPPGAPRVGQSAPDFTLHGPDQQAVQLSQLHGKPVVVNFWATWCGPCSAEMPNIEKVYQKHSNGEVAILAVNQSETADEVRGYADLYHLHFILLLDTDARIGNSYRVQALPTTVFIDRTGIIREIHIGGPMSPDFLEGRIQSLLR
jgi:cytochrome c biogenesis protein CcmG, thiol:disulfide interchange protein DsbE